MEEKAQKQSSLPELDIMTYEEKHDYCQFRDLKGGTGQVCSDVVIIEAKDLNK